MIRTLSEICICYAIVLLAIVKIAKYSFYASQCLERVTIMSTQWESTLQTKFISRKGPSNRLLTIKEIMETKMSILVLHIHILLHTIVYFAIYQILHNIVQGQNLKSKRIEFTNNGMLSTKFLAIKHLY